MSCWKKWAIFFLAMLALFGLARVYYRLTDDFRIANMTYALPFEAPWKAPSLNAEEYQHLQQILDQKFSYIGKGAQCYAFVSKDGQYVLKFFKFKHLKPNFAVEYLPSIPPFQAFKESSIDRKKRKLIKVFDGYDLAFRENRDNAKLIYLHLVPTQNLHMKVTVIDKLGLERTIDLDEVVFLVQKKGDTLRTRLKAFLNQHQVAEAKQAMMSILGMYISEYEKGIYDHDHGILHNTGFIDDQPFHLDVGNLHYDERMKQSDFYKKDFEHVIWKMDVWIKANYPQYYPEFSSFLSQQYQKWTGEMIDTTAIDPKLYKKKRKLIGL